MVMSSCNSNSTNAQTANVVGHLMNELFKKSMGLSTQIQNQLTSVFTNGTETKVTDINN
jgi:hypothetical protein